MQHLMNKLQSFKTDYLPNSPSQQNGFKLATGIMGMIVVALLCWRVISNRVRQGSEAITVQKTNESRTTPASPNEIQLTGAYSNSPERTTSLHITESPTKKSANSISQMQSSLALRVGRIGQTPSRDSLIRLDRLPQTDQEVWRIYADSQDRCGKMLPEGNPVEDIGSITLGQIGTFGRINALTIGLELEQAGRSKLPGVVVNEVLSYFERHRLSVQPTLYHDADGQLYFGTECQTAFYDLSHLAVTQRPEPMITSAVARFRGLGVTSKPNAPTRRDRSMSDVNLGRTLAMAFAFEQSQGLATETLKRQQSVELIFLHLPLDVDPTEPHLEAFITSNQRQQLHRIDPRTQSLQSSVPTISSKIRFDKTVLLGMYPSEPVVTDIQFRSSGSIAMQQVMELTRQDRTNGPFSVTEILDSFDTLMAENAGQLASQPAIEPWLEKVRRRKQMELDAALNRKETIR